LPGLDTESNRPPVPPGILLSSLNFYAVNQRRKKIDVVAVYVNVTVYQLEVLKLSNNVNLPFVLYGCDHWS